MQLFQDIDATAPDVFVAKLKERGFDSPARLEAGSSPTAVEAPPDSCGGDCCAAAVNGVHNRSASADGAPRRLAFNDIVVTLPRDRVLAVSLPMAKLDYAGRLALPLGWLQSRRGIDKVIEMRARSAFAVGRRNTLAGRRFRIRCQ